LILATFTIQHLKSRSFDLLQVDGCQRVTIFETKRTPFSALMKLHPKQILKNQRVYPSGPFGIEIAAKILKFRMNIADKAKPRVIVGRKAAGPKSLG
jgi:hypothetical protein